MDKNNPTSSRRVCSVIGVAIDSISWSQALERISVWAATHQSRQVVISNVHSVVTTLQDEVFADAVRRADMVTPDGAPIAWLMKRFGFKSQERINGPDLMWFYCAEAEIRGESIYLYGGKQSTLDVLRSKLLLHFPALKIVGAYSPPFRALTEEEDATVVAEINASGAGTVWVSLGCPKQEIWIAQHRDRINAVMIGVGAAFDYHAGTVTRAPLWMQRSGLEWFYRLCSEPRRLWKRYFFTNTLFLYHAGAQLLRYWLKRSDRRDNESNLN
jgi:N-acetylglucosaminyldiphosphoundecaprenol N-acetyl-beta-D-mannosaminyltransferase